MEKKVVNEIYLRGFEMEDEDFLLKLRMDEDVFRLTGGNKCFLTKEHSKKLLRENLISDGSRLYLMICSKETDVQIGYVSIINIDHFNKKVEWGGIIIDKKFSGRGLATVASGVMLKFIFEEMNMNKVYGYCLKEHITSVNMLKKLGFVEEGELKEHLFKNNKYNTAYYVGLLKSEYFNNIKKGVQ